MAIFSSSTLPQKHLFSSITLCKYSIALKFSSVSQTKSCSRLIVVRAPVGKMAAKISITSSGNELSTNFWDFVAVNESKTGFPSLRSINKRVVSKFVKNLVNTVTEDKAGRRLVQVKNGRKKLDFRERREESLKNNTYVSSKDENIGFKTSKTVGSLVDRKRLAGKGENSGEIGEEKVDGKGSKRNDEAPLKLKLDRCSKAGDVLGAIQLFDQAQREGTKMGQYPYTVILYLCSSAASGVVQPAKSGSANRQKISVDYSMKSEDFPKADSCRTELSAVKSKQSRQLYSEMGFEKSESSSMKKKVICSNESLKPNTSFSGEADPRKESRDDDDDSTSCLKDEGRNQDKGIIVSKEFQKYALQRGFEIYEKMCLEKVPMNEATLTSVARMAMAMGDGEKAFEMVKQMKSLGINPRLRSYGPALSAFCSSKNIDKAFSLEKHMLDHGVFPGEQELEALFRISVEAGKADKVYYMLHQLRASLRQVSPSTADLISSWFKSKAASMVGKANCDKRKIREAMENGGGGWHELGWLGKGKWSVFSSNVGEDGRCKSCGKKLATIDLDPIETEAFAESVSSIARKRENSSSFEKFQKWLDYYGPFEAVIDAANVGLFSQRKFMPSKVNLIVNGIRQKFPSRKWPLIVLHNRRISGNKMDTPVNKAFIEKWRNADALYATPTGSNDDWYWLYAAIKFKCLIVTNDKMRDHTFQLLGNDFFPKWKERHQVHFSFSDAGPVFHMPPPCSVVIQESEEGDWHIPIVSEHADEAERRWLCIRRDGKAQMAAARAEEEIENGMVKAAAESKMPENLSNYTNLRKIFSTAVFSENSTLLSEIEAAERVGDCIIDFQI